MIAPRNFQRTYSQMLRDGMRRQGWSLRDVAQRVGYSYEHVRKLTKGTTCPSKALNAELAKLFGWDPAAAWRLAAHDHLRRRATAIAPGIAPPRDGDMQTLWSQLTREQQDTLLGIARAFAAVNMASEPESPLPGPPKPQLTLLR